MSAPFHLRGRSLALTFLAVMCSGCSFFTTRETEEIVPESRRQYIGEERSMRADGHGIRAALTLQPQLRLPCKIAVFLQPAAEDSTRLTWSAEDKKLVSGWEATLRRKGIASELFLMSDIVVDGISGTSIPKLRLAAAKHGASALLIVRGSRTLDEYYNPLAALYLTVVGYFIIPGSHADANVSLDGALFDVANEYLYLSLEAEGRGESFGPGAILKGDRATADAKEEALLLFGEALLDRIERLR